MAPHAWVLAILLALPADARALEVSAIYRYRIHHEIFGDIGEHEMTVRREDGAIVVEHTAELAVEILGITAFHRRTRFREVWRDERLVAFDGLVEDNGEPFPVAAHAVRRPPGRPRPGEDGLKRPPIRHRASPRWSSRSSANGSSTARPVRC